MKLKWKIYFLCLTIYVMSTVLTAVMVTSSSCDSLLRNEKERCFDEEKNIKTSITLYLSNNITSSSEEAIRLERYAGVITEMFSAKSVSLQVYSRDYKLLSSSFPVKYTNTETEMNNLGNGKYILKRLNGKHYLIINEKVDFDVDYIILTTIKDVTYIDVQRQHMYLSFLWTSIIGLVVISFLIVIMGGFITKPIEHLTAAANRISSGNYEERVDILSKDEIGTLSQQFNLMAQEIQNKILELKSESQNKQDFIDNLTHELRTPLTSIIGYSELLINIKYDERSFNKGLGFINSEGKRILNIVNALMDLILARVKAINPVHCSIKELILSAEASTALRAGEANIQIECHGEDFTAMVDEELFKMVFINLIENAIKASAPYSCIDIYLSKSDVEGQITFEDHGRGISEEHIKKILEPFYRVDKSRSRSEGGLGLGLALVKSIVISHQGNIDIKSEVTKGTSVTVTIPLKEVR